MSQGYGLYENLSIQNRKRTYDIICRVYRGLTEAELGSNVLWYMTEKDLGDVNNRQSPDFINEKVRSIIT